VATLLGAEIAQPVAPTVIENPDPEIRVVRSHRADDGAIQNRSVFIVGADQDVDERARLHQPGHIAGNGRRSRRTPRQQDPCDGPTNPGQEFSGKEGAPKQPIHRAELRQGRDSPKQVVPGQRKRKCDERRADKRVFAVGPGKDNAKKARCHQRRRDWF